ncbi:EF-hand domain-containing protein [Rhizobium leucaenae]|uniref:Ca2+-binding EF-hand superfamily protein n=1 Tax=Rhizobium leucaenae TaxID=29450 RepID=A0A7W7EJ68_9HYPH|nr:EF-hand domain-containing protein [Rhizobium leucaenae]MBB4567480.1 Ca2+-binding EF-hand superfamily protein [Rhizobium leucaenae]MBB6301954.1 Ca2+-binding EF-hand superfamily protein [Rhizobium leucaenae]
MNGKKLLLAGLSATLLVGAAVQASFAAPQGNDGMGGPGGRWHRPGFSPEVAYVRMLKQFDTNGDMKISKDEVKAGVDKIFDEIDTNKDGQITPGELRAYRKERVKQWKAEHAKSADEQAQSNQDKGDQGKGDQTQGDQAQNDDNQDGGMHRGHHPHGRFMHEAAMMRTTLLFQRVDTDENGQISKQEAEDAANKLFDRMDRNHDGVISLDDMPNRPLL